MTGLPCQRCRKPQAELGEAFCESCFAALVVADVPTRELDGLRAPAALDAVYLERARVLAVATRMALTLGMRAGLAEHPASDTAWDDEWRTIVFLDLPTGQCSWHLHSSQVRLFKHLPRYDGAWDGHTTDEKYARCEAYAECGEKGGSS